MRVRSARRTLGISQAQIAENCGLSVPYISRIEQGKSNPTIAALSALAEALSIPIVELVAEAPGTDEAPASGSETLGNGAVSPSGSAGRDDLESAGGNQGSYVPKGLRVERSDLLAWANTEGAGLKLPELVRRLVRETAPNGARIHFASGTGALSGGWDGLVECGEAHPYVPKGRSGWELSTDRNAQRKAVSDYWKRCDGVPDEERAAMAYVAVNCGPWTKAREFEEQMAAEGDFQEVRALNVDHLVAWLAEAPEATTWLREEMGQPISGVEPLKQWWTRWLESTHTPLGEGVVLAGRREFAEKLRRACAAGGIVTVGGSTQGVEVLAFIAAALADTENGVGEFTDALYVDDRDTARRLLVSPPSQAGPGSALTLVVRSKDIAEGLSPKRPKCAVVPVPGSDDADVVVEGIDISEASEELRAQGFDHDEAWKLAQLGRRSLLALRRHLAQQPELHRPSWADEGDPVLRRCLLLGCWDGSHEGDRTAVERFCESTYPAVVERLENKLGDSEPPLVRVGARWHAVSQAGAFQAIGGRFQQSEFSDLANLATEVLGEHDPLAGLQGAELVQAQFEGFAAAHSEHLKKGLVGSLAVLAESGERLSAGAAGIVSDAVAKLLSSANSNPEPSRWQALAQHLPVLAEASPDEFLRGVRTGMADESSPLVQALLESNDDLFEFSMGRFRLQLVAALDVLAWSPDHLPAAAELLAALAERDEMDWSDNQPARALRAIMCPWSPNTSATLDTRMEVLESMHGRHPEAAWLTAVSMLPSPGYSKTDGCCPRFRTWKADRKPVKNWEYNEAISRTSASMLAWASLEPHLYADLIAASGRLLPQSRSDLRRNLRRVAETSDDLTRKAIWSAIRDMVARHRRFSDAHWALPPAEIGDFEALMPLFRPASAADLHRWVFQPDAWMFADELLPPESDFQTRHAALLQRQTEAVAAIHGEGGIAAVLEFAASDTSSRKVGVALARVCPPDCDDRMRAELAGGDHHRAETARAYFSARYEKDGWPPIDAQITASSSPELKAELLRASRDPQGAWVRLDELDDDVADEFWSQFSGWDLPFEEELAVEAAHRLGQAGQPGTALNILASHCYRFTDDPDFARTAANLLRTLAELDTGEAVELAHDSLTCLLGAINRQVDAVGKEEVAQIEWLYLPWLGWGAETPCLHKLMAQDPDFFAEVVTVAHKEESNDKAAANGSEDRGSQQSLAAYGLLREWPYAPGLGETGQIDAAALTSWVDQARKRLAETGRSRVGDVAIGAALAAAPTNEEGVPDPAICDVIEGIASEEIEAGYTTAIFNSLGVISVSVGGGRQEYNALAERYRSIGRQLNTRWHRTSSAYIQLAARYQYIANDSDTVDGYREAGFGY